jgi:chromosome segregation ATPase
VDTLLDIATDLEARDARIAGELARVESLQADVEEIRVHAEAAAAFLAALPAAIAGHARAEDDAEEERAAAQQALRDAEAEESPYAVERAKDRILDADRRAARAREHQAALEREGAEWRDDAAGLARRAGVDDLEAVLAWASQRRGELVLERSSLARERESIVREASELLGSVTGDANAATSVAGLRARLERALP